jgi:hypothetical protein
MVISIWVLVPRTARQRCPLSSTSYQGPGIVQISGATEATENDYLLAGVIVGHGKIGATVGEVIGRLEFQVRL